MASDRILELLRRPVDVDEYTEIRELWKTHSIAEDQRDIAGLISTLTPDCVYELPQLGQTWEGHEGARRFYTELLGAFPDIHFDLTDIVVGPQGVCEEAAVTGTFQQVLSNIVPLIASRSVFGLREHKWFETFSGSMGRTRSGKYTDVPRMRASRSIAEPGWTKCATSAMWTPN